MQCLKCGREIGEDRVFCTDCLLVMEANPVKPGTPVVLPRRENQPRRTTKRAQLKPEETIAALQKTIRRQRFIMACSALLFLAITVLLCWLLYLACTTAAIGSNYVTLPTGQ